MSNTNGPFVGSYEQLREFRVDGMWGKALVSLTALAALRRTNPMLAKHIFEESYLALMREMLANEGSAEHRALLESVENRFLQEDLLLLQKELETIIVLHVTERHYAEVQEKIDKPLLTPERKLTPDGGLFLRNAATEAEMCVRGVFICAERLVTLLLAAVVSGGEAMTEAVEQVRRERRPGYLTAIAGSLCLNDGFDPGGEHLLRVMKYIESLPDDRLVDVWFGVQACAFWPYEAMNDRLHDLLGMPREIRF